MGRHDFSPLPRVLIELPIQSTRYFNVLASIAKRDTAGSTLHMVAAMRCGFMAAHTAHGAVMGTEAVVGGVFARARGAEVGAGH